MYFKWENNFNIINIIHTCTNIYTWRWYGMHSFSKIYKLNRIADFLIYLHIIDLKNALKTGVWSCTVQYFNLSPPPHTHTHTHFKAILITVNTGGQTY